MCRKGFLLTLAIVAGLSGCAGSHPTARPRPQRSAPINRPAALAFARAVNLGPADLPGFTASSDHESASAREAQLEHEMLACAGAQGGRSAGTPTSLADLGSGDFEFHHLIAVSSEVSVSTSSAAAAAELAALRGAHLRACFSRYLQELFAGRRYAGASIGLASISSGTPPAPGTAGGFGWRITATLREQQLQLPLYIDVLGFVDGPSRVTLFSSGALRPFPAQDQQRLFELLLRRARAHSP